MSALLNPCGAMQEIWESGTLCGKLFVVGVIAAVVFGIGALVAFVSLSTAHFTSLGSNAGWNAFFNIEVAGETVKESFKEASTGWGAAFFSSLFAAIALAASAFYCRPQNGPVYDEAVVKLDEADVEALLASRTYGAEEMFDPSIMTHSMYKKNNGEAAEIEKVLQQLTEQQPDATGLNAIYNTAISGFLDNEEAQREEALTAYIDSRKKRKNGPKEKRKLKAIARLKKSLKKAKEREDWDACNSLKRSIEALEKVQRRLAAIPLVETPAVHESTKPSMSTLGAFASVAVCIGYVLRRRCLKAKESRRDSFGFLPDSCRTTLNAAEMNV